MTPASQTAALVETDQARSNGATTDSPPVHAPASDATPLLEQQPLEPSVVGGTLLNLDFWRCVSWEQLHDPVGTSKVVPEAVRHSVAELRHAICKAYEAATDLDTQDSCLKALLFSDRLLFAVAKKGRGGARGQRGDTLARTIAKRLRLAWEGAWNTLWSGSAAEVGNGAAALPTPAQMLAKEVAAIQQALAEEDVREALRIVDGQAQMAPDWKARQCLPALFPPASTQPLVEDLEADGADAALFQKELSNAYRRAARNRGAGPGGTRGEHWSWMPYHEDEWASFSRLVQSLQLGRAPQAAIQAFLSARILAGDREEADKVRPFALGNFHRRCASKAVARAFKKRVAAAIGEAEYSVGNPRGAECMHKTVLLDVDIRPHCCKLSFDVSNAHNEFCRHEAVRAVRTLVPKLLPWVKIGLCTDTSHVHVARDGSRVQLPKQRGGDQGDALTNYIFPLVYKRATDAVRDTVRNATLPAEPTREYCYQDDLEAVCSTDILPELISVYEHECAAVGLRSNRRKMHVTPGREVAVADLPQGLAVDPRATVLRHGASFGVSSVPAMPAASPADGSQLALGSPEVAKIFESRSKLYARLHALKEAGLPQQISAALMRTRTGGDYGFVARVCGIPSAEAAQLDAALLAEVCAPFAPADLDDTGKRRVFLAGRNGGLGYQSVALNSPAALAASWHGCLPSALQRLELPAVSALASLSPWARAVLPGVSSTLQTALGDATACVGDAGLKASQHLLAEAPQAAAIQTVLEDLAVNQPGAAACRSAAGTGASSWLHEPTAPQHHLSDPQFCVALRTRLHLDLPSCAGTCRHRRQDGTECGHLLDAKGQHARSCAVGGWLVRRHNAACAVLCEWAEQQNCLVYREVVLPTSAPDRPEARIDLVIRPPGAGALYIDLTVVSALTREALQHGSARRDGAAATVAARHKRAKYPQCQVTPFVIEDHGRLGEDAVALIKLLAPIDPVRRSKAVRALHQSLGAVLQRHAADAVLAATRGTLVRAA